MDLTGLSHNNNIEMVAIGALGILAGFSPIAVVNKVVRHPYVLTVSYALYTIAIAAWNVPYPLQLWGPV